MRSPRVRHPLITSTLASIVASSALGAPLAAAALEPDAIALPTAGERAGDAGLQPDDSPHVTAAAIDLDALGEAALERVDRFTGADWDIEELVAELGTDPEAAFAFVRDHIGFDPYPGILRGAHGTLVARAGNAWDRALLLEALLEAQGRDARLVTAMLDDETATSVLERALAGPFEPLVDPDPAGILGLDLEAIVTRARRDNALLADGLGAAYDELGAGSSAGANAVTEHAWVQLLGGTEPLDLDPTLAEAETGTALSVDGEPLEAPPEGLRHQLRIGVTAESLADGVLDEERVLDFVLDAAAAADQEIWLTFQADGEGLAGSILDVMGEAAWVPLLSVGHDDYDGTPFQLGGGGDAGDFFFGGGTPELTALTVELTAEGAGLEPVSAERVLLDRVAPADRASGTFVAELLEPLSATGAPVPALAQIHQVLVSNGAADLRAHAVNRALAVGWSGDYAADPAAAADLPLVDLFYPLAVANQTLVLASEQLLTDDIGSAGEARAFIGRPRAYLATFAPYGRVADGSAITTDLALDGIDVGTAEGAAPGLPGQVRLWQGVLQQALETELALVRAAAVDPEGRSLGSVSLDMEGVPTLVTPESADTVDADRGALRRALGAGSFALLVEGSPNGAFWAIDPDDGQTSSVFEPGVRVGSVGGGNYVNSSAGGPRYVVDPKTGNTLGTIRDGKFTPARRPPPNRCSGGTEYVLLLGCVSIPASMTVGMVTNVVITAVVAWAIVLLELLFLT